jgi:hypothetical protein
VIDALWKLNAMYHHLLPKNAPRFCYPGDESGRPALIQVIVDYLETHPEQHRAPGIVAAHATLVAAYPCKR